MNDVVVIEVVGNILPLELAVVVIGVHLLRHRFVQIVVEVA